MDAKTGAVLATVFAGGLIALQAPINSTLGRAVGSLAAASFSFAVGLAALVTITVLLGGVGGAAIVATTLVAVRELGAGGVTAAVIAGQLALSVVLDRLGVLGLDERAVTWEKVLGIALLAAGTVLIVRE